MFKITKAIAKKLPAIGQTDGKDKAEIKVPLKIFNPNLLPFYVDGIDPHSGFGLLKPCQKILVIDPQHQIAGTDWLTLLNKKFSHFADDF